MQIARKILFFLRANSNFLVKKASQTRQSVVKTVDQRKKPKAAVAENALVGAEPDLHEAGIDQNFLRPALNVARLLMHHFSQRKDVLSFAVTVSKHLAAADAKSSLRII